MFLKPIRNLIVSACIVAGSAAHAFAGTASFIVVHGIPGRDVAATLDPVLPVDVLVGGQYCLLKNLTFGEIAGPFEVPSGTYPVVVSLANPIAPCTNAAVITASVTLNNGDFGAVVAQLSPAGAPTAGVYPINVSTIASGKQRVVTVHAAAAPTVAVRARSLDASMENLIFNLATGQENVSIVDSKPAFNVALQAQGKPATQQLRVNATDRSLLFLVAVGSSTSGSLGVLSKVLPNIF